MKKSLYIFLLITIVPFINYNLTYKPKLNTQCLALKNLFKGTFGNHEEQIFKQIESEGIDIFNFNKCLSFEEIEQIRTILINNKIPTILIKKFFIKMKELHDKLLKEERRLFLEAKIKETENKLQKHNISPQELIDFIAARDEDSINAAKKISFLMMFGCGDLNIPNRGASLFHETLKNKGCKCLIISGGIGGGTLTLYKKVQNRFGNKIFEDITRRTGKHKYERQNGHYFLHGIWKQDVDEEDIQYFEQISESKAYLDFYTFPITSLNPELKKKYADALLSEFSNIEIINKYISEADIFVEITIKELQQYGYNPNTILIVDITNIETPEIAKRIKNILEDKEQGIIIFIEQLSSHTGWNVHFSRKLLEKSSSADKLLKENLNIIIMHWALLQRRAFATTSRHFTPINTPPPAITPPPSRTSQSSRPISQSITPYNQDDILEAILETIPITTMRPNTPSANRYSGSISPITILMPTPEQAQPIYPRFQTPSPKPSINILNYAIKINYDELSLEQKYELFYGTPNIFAELHKLKKLQPYIIDHTPMGEKFDALINAMEEEENKQLETKATTLLEELTKLRIETHTSIIKNLYLSFSFINIKTSVLKDIDLKKLDTVNTAI